MAFKVVNETVERTWQDPKDVEVKIHYWKLSSGSRHLLGRAVFKKHAEARLTPNEEEVDYLSTLLTEMRARWEGVTDEAGVALELKPELVRPCYDLLLRFINAVYYEEVTDQVGNS